MGAHQQITLRDLWPACGHHDRKEQEVAGPPLLHHIEGLCAAAATSPASVCLWPQKKTKKKTKKEVSRPQESGRRRFSERRDAACDELRPR